MTNEAPIIGFNAWLKTAPGQYLLAWEQEQVDHAVADIFGFHALQLGLPALEGLRANRMPQRWLAGLDGVELPSTTWPDQNDGQFGLVPVCAEDGKVGRGVSEERDRNGVFESKADFDKVIRRPALYCEAEALPFPAASLDLVVVPHALEQALDPHRCLSEVARVLRPEGRVVITGFNLMSLWGARQRAGQFSHWLGFNRRSMYLPEAEEFIGYWRLRDWLRLLDLELEQSRVGCFLPPFNSQPWLHRWRWLEPVGAHWWPVLGAAYAMVAVKRVRGGRLIGLARRQKARARAASAAVAHRQGPPHSRFAMRVTQVPREADRYSRRAK